MADEYEGGGGGGKIPKWVYIAAGGGVLIILLMSNKSGKSSVATDNLLAAEIDAMMKNTQEIIEAQQKQYKEEQKAAYDDFKQSIQELLDIRYGGLEPPSGKYYPPTPKNKKKMNIGGDNDILTVPGQIDAAMNDNYIMGFDYRKMKVG